MTDTAAHHLRIVLSPNKTDSNKTKQNNRSQFPSGIFGSEVRDVDIKIVSPGLETTVSLGLGLEGQEVRSRAKGHRTSSSGENWAVLTVGGEEVKARGSALPEGLHDSVGS